jgi:hypothetical protein
MFWEVFDMSMNVGDWVTAYNKGIFKVDRIIQRYYDESHDKRILGSHQVGDLMNDPIVVLKKCFSSSLKPSMGWDICAQSLCHLVDSEVLSNIEGILSTNPKLIDKIDKYEIPQTKLLHNISLYLGDSKEHKEEV